ncbi:hypothetical protein [Natronobacterium texcoconense]|uniref:Uncharacterized protein n=1 Tax=Natronobacterium texcoconense TaxID=1095778 RepID=A0A1H1G8U0_NATTX|nr:hypothetical protein [Natronobacterium texcoconense]SDR09607.1 hypothetical protein SAMN04489842_2317 [Natronobacterium texcoconense]
MVLANRLETLERTCKRYGPGRLPGADRTRLGAGYAGASAALVVALVFALGMAVLHWLGSPFGVGHVFWTMSAVVALPIVVPVAFLAATLVWSLLPVDGSGTGAFAGAVTALLTYLGSLAVVFLVVSAALVVDGGPLQPSLVEAGQLTVLIGLFAVVFSGWLAVLFGSIGGGIYESVRASSP